MPRAPTELTVLQSAQEDLAEIKQHNPDHAARILTKINDWSGKNQVRTHSTKAPEISDRL